MNNADAEPLLPNTIAYDEYWSTYHGSPLSRWLPVLEAIRSQHGLPAGEWSRFRLGRNLVFGSPELVVKLAPPFWAADIAAEADTLRFVYGRLPLASPAVVAQGSAGTWAYLVQQRLPGEPLRFHWAELSSTQRAALAQRQGELMAALHALPIASTPPGLDFSWTSMLDEQRADCRRGLLAAGVPAQLLDDLDAYLEPVWPLLRGKRERVLLHGDLDAINLLVERRGGELQFSGWVDWGDAKLGPWQHELISPGVHTLIGDGPALDAWYRGYGLGERAAAVQHDIMARSILYYAEELRVYLERVPGALGCRRWSEVATLFWNPRIDANRN